MKAIGKKRTRHRTPFRPSGVADAMRPAEQRIRMGRRVLAAAAILVLTVSAAPGVLAHHFTGEVQLWASRFDFREAPGGVAVSVLLTERESGESVSGFGVRVSATDPSGRVVGPFELQESEPAVYLGTLPLGPGVWEIVATTHQGGSALPAIESAHRKALEIDAAGRLLTSTGGGSGPATVLAIVLPVCAVAVVLLIVLRRRRMGAHEDGGDDGDLNAGDPDVPVSSEGLATAGGER